MVAPPVPEQGQAARSALSATLDPHQRFAQHAPVKQFIRKELTLVAVILGLTLMVLVPVTYLVGSKTLGPYAGGEGLQGYVGAVLSSLATGNLALWFFVFSPLIAITVLRVGWALYSHLGKSVKPAASSAAE